MIKNVESSPLAEARQSFGRPRPPRPGASEEVAGFFQELDEFVRFLEARRIERDLCDGELIKEDDDEPEPNRDAPGRWTT